VKLDKMNLNFQPMANHSERIKARYNVTAPGLVSVTHGRSKQNHEARAKSLLVKCDLIHDESSMPGINTDPTAARKQYIWKCKFLIERLMSVSHVCDDIAQKKNYLARSVRKFIFGLLALRIVSQLSIA
jgi:hypothetical protein